MKKYKIITPYDCLVISAGQEVFLKSGEALEFEKSETLSIYPTDDTVQKIAFSLNPEKEEISSFYFSYPLDEEKVFFLSKGMLLKNYIITSLDVDGKPCEIQIGDNKVVFTYLQYKKEISLQSSFNKYQTGVISQNCYILLTSNQIQTLVLFNTISGEVNLLSGEQIKISGSHISVTENLENVARHIIENEYIVTNEKLVKTSSSIQYQNGRPVIATINETIPYAFMEAIQVEDYELASFYLDTSMKRKIDSDHLKEFFGDFQAFYAIDPKTFMVKSSGKKEVFRFNVKENKISDIESLE